MNIYDWTENNAERSLSWKWTIFDDASAERHHGFGWVSYK